MFRVIGIDLGASFLRGGIVSQKGEMEVKIKEKTQKEDLTEQIIKVIRNLLKSKEIEAIGLGVPGPLDFKKGLILNPPNLPKWHNLPLLRILKKEFKPPIFLDNDGNCALLGEKWQGVAKNLKNALMLTLGTGIGGGILIDGKVYRGKSGAGAELGHMIIDPQGPSCNCGQKGCLEALIQKDRENETEYLSSALISLYNIFEPEAIILGGGWAERKLLKKLERKIFPKIRLVLAQLGQWSGVYGAAYGALECL